MIRSELFIEYSRRAVTAGGEKRVIRNCPAALPAAATIETLGVAAGHGVENEQSSSGGNGFGFGLDLILDGLASLVRRP